MENEECGNRPWKASCCLAHAGGRHQHAASERECSRRGDPFGVDPCHWNQSRSSASRENGLAGGIGIEIDLAAGSRTMNPNEGSHKNRRIGAGREK